MSWSFAHGDKTDIIAKLMTQPANAETAARIWQRDPDLWKPGDANHAKVITNRLGWLDVIGTMREALPRLSELSRSVARDGTRDVVLLGMGGSSLCPEVLRTSFGKQSGHPTLHVLDTTDPAAIADLTASIDAYHTVFVVASKSGTTLETLSHFSHFHAVVQAADVQNAGAHFIAITDPGSQLAALAAEHGFRDTFENPPDIGGRYSALSFFGLVPAALAGIDIEKFLERAAEMRTACAEQGVSNGGLALGIAMAHFHEQGRDKVTVLAPPEISAFSLWAEQLIAESTGKEGVGIIPIGDEPIGIPDVYGNDRLFVALSIGGASTDDRVDALRAAGNPVVTLQLRDVYDLGAEFFRWEFATAVAGAALHIDPFDEPNVQESKDNTKRVLGEYQSAGSLPAEPAGTTADVRDLLAHINSGDYVALMAYVTPDDANHVALQKLRVTIRDQHRVATTLGFGPRFLHSTGQLHKGGPNTGVYIQFTQVDRVDVPIPNQTFTFSVLKHAQAIGDLQSLQSHERRVVHVDLGNDVASSLADLVAALGAASVTG